MLTAFLCHVCVSSLSVSYFTAYTHSLYYARLANKLYDVSQLADPQVAITVSAYDEDQAIADLQGRLLNVDLKIALEKM